MGSAVLKSLACPNCQREVPIHITSNFALCVCGERVVWKDSYLLAPVFTPEPLHKTRTLALALQRAHWRKLHFYPWSVPIWSPDVARKWYSTWLQTIPNTGCRCQENWLRITRKYPPRFATRQDFADWGFMTHNLVNADLDKSVLTWEKARETHTLMCHRPDDKISVGIFVNCFNEIGGTETWSSTIFPELTKYPELDIACFASAHKIYGNTSCFTKVGIRVYEGPDKIANLVPQVDVAIIWGVEVLDIGQAKVIAVDHGDMRANWVHSQLFRMFNRLTHIVAVNKEVAKFLNKSTQTQVTYIPNAVSPARVKALHPMRKPDGKKVVVWAHRIAEEKRVDLAVAAMQYLPDWVMYIIGGREARPLPNNVIAVGQEPTLANWLAIADVFLSTSYMEGFGLSMAEAMLADVPVVATPCGLGLHTDLVEPIPMKPSPRQIADAIQRATCKPQAKAYIEREHSVGQIVEAWKNLICKIADKHVSQVLRAPEAQANAR